jgi:CheY-like chemotaxis protein
MQHIRVLIIDDSEIDRYILSRQLKEAGVCCIDERDDGMAGLEFFDDLSSTTCPQVIFLDINMPHINGFEFLERFAKLKQHNQILSSVVMMYSSSERTEDRDLAYQYDFVKDFVIKGETDVNTLKEKLTSHLNV